MKKWVTDKLICPQCLPSEIPLKLTSIEEHLDDVTNGELACRACGSRYPIRHGVATILPEDTRIVLNHKNGYNSPEMLSAYLWSHFSDLLSETRATDAYRIWSDSFQISKGDALDVGCAVGRLSLELAQTHQRVVGIDTSATFIRKAREILQCRHLKFELIVEGKITEPREFIFDRNWNFDNVEFIVADALALPFRQDDFATVAAINLLEKVPDPLKHLTEVDRVLQQRVSRFLFSDPFSWDAKVSPPEQWLGGNGNQRYSQRGIETMRRLFGGEYDIFTPPLSIVSEGNVSWKIRKTENLWEHITSQFLVGQRQ